ncbi:MAG: HTTM domain-containing protein [Bacteroidota bacterium]
MKSITRRLSANWLFTEVDNSPLVLFRMFFGLLVIGESIGAIVTGWVHRAFIAPEFTFTFIGFEWLQPLPGNGMYYYYVLMAFAGLSISLGYRYRLGAVTFAILWTGVYLMQKTNYNNHYYLMVLLGWVMATMPANKRFSLDVFYGRVTKSETCPRICHKFFVAQVVLVYVVASLNKVYPGWLNAEPISMWFNAKASYPVIGGLLKQEWFQYFIAYGGIGYDMLIVPVLLFRETRKIGLILSIVFNIFNSIVFQIGVFPYLMIAFSLFFYNPEQISKFFFRKRIPAREKVYQGQEPIKKLVYYGFMVTMVFQLLLCVRHHLYKGDVHWTEEGHRMAWQMMLRAKRGTGKYTVVNNDTKESAVVDPKEYMQPKQARKLAFQPDFVWQFSRRLEKIYNDKGWDNISIYFKGRARLNKGEYGPLIDPEADLLQKPWDRFGHSDWIIPYPPKKKQK